MRLLLCGIPVCKTRPPLASIWDMLGASCKLWLLFLVFYSEAQAQAPTRTLPYYLVAALESNRELIEARAAIHQVEGSRIVVRSRFLPRIDLTARYDAQRSGFDGRTDEQLASSLRLSQRLFEFGADFVEEVENRAVMRQAVYAYKDEVYQVLAGVWETYHLILLQDRQMAIRRQSRDNFQEAYESRKARFERQLATESDVLNARLNVLNEELALNSIERQQFNHKMALLRLVGQSIGSKFHLRDEVADFDVDLDRAVEIALGHSVAIALNAERLKEQQRVLREIDWEYSPDLTLHVGVEDGRRNAQLNLDRQARTWGLDLSSEYLTETDPLPGLRDEARWFTRMEVRIPLFEGGSRQGEETREKARLRQIEMALEDVRASVELQVSQAYQSMLEARGRQSIQGQRVNIARRRLAINQILKDKGQADENLLESVRQQFFNEQDRLFQDQATYIRRIADLRRQMGYFE